MPGCDRLHAMTFGLLRGMLSGGPPAISFSGGLGAQMLSAAGYFRLEMDGRQPTADLDYFDTAPRIAKSGSNEVSIWPWQLDSFGITPETFRRMTRGGMRSRTLRDSPQKTSLGIRGLQTPEIRERFGVPKGLDELLPIGFPGRFNAIHVRRGDYLNVASHVVPEGAFVVALAKYARDCDALVFLSDGKPSTSTLAELNRLFKHLWVPESLSAWETHRLLRASALMVGSNSQFSLVAALLHDSGRAILPSRWAGPTAEQAAWEHDLTGLCAFRAL